VDVYGITSALSPAGNAVTFEKMLPVEGISPIEGLRYVGPGRDSRQVVQGTEDKASMVVIYPVARAVWRPPVVPGTVLALLDQGIVDSSPDQVVPFGTTGCLAHCCQRGSDHQVGVVDVPVDAGHLAEAEAFGVRYVARDIGRQESAGARCSLQVGWIAQRFVGMEKSTGSDGGDDYAGGARRHEILPLIVERQAPG